MRVAVTGASGFLGTALTATLCAAGHEVLRLVRSATAGADEVSWDPAAGRLDPATLAGTEAVVHLAGEPIASGRWTAEKKARIRESRVGGTRLLAGALASLQPRPRVLVSGSAIGFYGHRGDEALTEDSAAGTGFLAETGRLWEEAADPARQAGIRVAHPRLGVVLAREGGALARMLTPFRWGLGSRLGNGRQWFSWITLRDALRAILRLIEDPSLSGPVNLVSPAPVTNAEFTRTLAHALSRFRFLPLPAFAVRLFLGEMGDALLLQGQRVLPARLEAAGFRFEDPMLEPALRRILES